MVTVTVTIENLAPDSGNFLTPVWVGFHDGSFDLYDPGAPASPALERLAEDGNTMPLSEAFAASGAGEAQATLVSDVGIPPIAPGETATMAFTLDRRAASSRYFSYASMVIPSNDAFVANGNPVAHRVFRNNGRFRVVDFIVYGTQVRDAGTELNDEDPSTTAFFGQMAPDTGQDEDVVVHDHVGFKLPGSGGILDDPMFANADFEDQPYPIARIRITTESAGGGDDDDDDDSDDDSSDS
ncbi:MAG: spondin domain-containing protein [Planctomycetota bacterium]